MVAKPLCFSYFFKGGCSTSNCKRLHKITTGHLKSALGDKEDIIECCIEDQEHCVDYLQGKCKNGDDCENNHILVDSINANAKRLLKTQSNHASKTSNNSAAIVVSNISSNTPNKNMEILILEKDREHDSKFNDLQMQRMNDKHESQLELLKVQMQMQQMMNESSKQNSESLHKLELDNLKNLDKVKEKSHEKDIEYQKDLTVVKVQAAGLKGKTEQMEKNQTMAPGWWGSGYGPWAYGRNPKYCRHGNNWSHCYEGPPAYCRHGSNLGFCCNNPFS